VGLFGNTGRDKELAKITEVVRQRTSAGQSHFVVPVYLMANGTDRLSMRRVQEEAVEHLRTLGFSVVATRVEDSVYTPET
jgi:hypothetical protein